MDAFIDALWTNCSKSSKTHIRFGLSKRTDLTFPSQSGVYCIKAVHEGSHYISCGRDGTIKLWSQEMRLQQQLEIRDYKTIQWLRALAFHTEGKTTRIYYGTQSSIIGCCILDGYKMRHGKTKPKSRNVYVHFAQTVFWSLVIPKANSGRWQCIQTSR